MQRYSFIIKWKTSSNGVNHHKKFSSCTKHDYEIFTWLPWYTRFWFNYSEIDVKISEFRWYRVIKLALCKYRSEFFVILFKNTTSKNVERFCLIFWQRQCVINIGNDNKQMWFASNKEVRLMIETIYLITTIYILFYALIGVTIVAIALIIALAVILSKSK